MGCSCLCPWWFCIDVDCQLVRDWHCVQEFVVCKCVIAVDSYHWSCVDDVDSCAGELALTAWVHTWGNDYGECRCLTWPQVAYCPVQVQIIRHSIVACSLTFAWIRSLLLVTGM